MLANVLITGESDFDEKNVKEMFNWSEVHSEKKHYLKIGTLDYLMVLVIIFYLLF